MKKFIIILIFLNFPFMVFAADFSDCKVVEVILAGEKNGHIALDCAIDLRPTCASAGNFLGFDKSTEEGKQYISIALTAFASGAKLTGYVDDDFCSPHQGNVALLRHLRMKH